MMCPCREIAGLDAAARAQRAEACFWPYHHAITGQIKRMREAGRAPALISLHSFTPVMQGFERPWHIGVLWNKDGRLAIPLLAGLARDPAICVGDNKPYDGRAGRGYGVAMHGEREALAHVLLELRQDQIDTHHGAAAWANCLAPLFEEILAQPDLRAACRHERARLHPRHRGGVSARRPGQPGPRQRSPAGDAERMPGAASQPGDARSSCALRSRWAPPSVPASPRPGRSLRGCAGWWPRSPAALASRPSPPPPILSPNGTARRRRIASATLHWPADHQALARRLVICGMHVHVGIEDPELRIDLMGQLAYFLPHLLALSTSSPFWEGRIPG